MPVWMKRVVLAFAVLFVAIQFVRPSRDNPPLNRSIEIDATQAVPAQVASVFARSCNDCHSNLTVWPWYSGVAPASWLTTRDVKEGRRAMNLSEWGAYSQKKRSELLKDMCEEVSSGEMPMSAYTLLHPAAKLRASDIKALCQWTHDARQALPNRNE